jgi:hypothetical protein
MAKQADIKKQVEYYLSDKNLTIDTFFNEKIKENKEVPINPLFNCKFRAGWIYLTL